MMREHAWYLAITCKEELEENLPMVIHLDEHPMQMRNLIQLDIDRIHLVLAEFEVGELSEIHEDLYLPLFDSLSHLTWALQLLASKHPRTDAIPAAQTEIGRALEELKRMTAVTTTA